MSKVDLNDVASGYALSIINTNFQKIEDELNNNVLYRDNPDGEPNQMDNILDMNSNRIINLGAPVGPNDAARLKDVTDAMSGIPSAAMVPFTPYGVATGGNVQIAIQQVIDNLGDGSGTADTIFYTAPYTGSIARTLTNKFTDVISVKDFGAVGNGIADDTTAIQNAINVASTRGGVKIVVPAGTYMFNANGLTMRSNVILSGEGPGCTKFKASVSQPSGMLVSFSGTSNWGVEQIEWDAGDFAIAGNVGIFNMNTNSDVFIRDCNFIKFNKFGIAINAAQRIEIDRNLLIFTTPALTQNQAINVSVASGQCNDIYIRQNYCIGSGIDLAGNRVNVIDNSISGWKFGAGITVEFGAEEFYIHGNNCFGSGTLPDVNATVPMGIECWAARSTISANRCYSNGGDGIDFGGQFTVVVGNICFNNGTGGGGNGIAARYADVGQNSSNSVVIGNVCFDTNGASGTQTVGYIDQNSSLSRIELFGNQFYNNKTSQMVRQATISSTSGPCIGFTTGTSPGTIANGSSSGGTFSWAGAKLGDVVEIAYSGSLQGCKLWAWVTGDNALAFRFENNTGGSVSLGSGSLTGFIKKPINYVNY